MIQNGKRELAYVAKITDIKPLDGYDRVEYAKIGDGWWCVVKKGDFNIGDLAIYFEVDSKLPERAEFEFCAKYNYRVKTQKMCKVLSQGLLMHPKDLNLKNIKEGEGLTEKLGVTYYEAEDNRRKSDTSKYTSMKARHKKFFSTKFGKWLMKREWGRKLCFLLLGKKNDKKLEWPYWVKKTDEERCQNCFSNMKSINTSWIATEKIDGTSTTFTMRQGKPKKRKLYICSRNVVFDKPEKEDKNFYKDTDGNVYVEMALKYRIEEVLNFILDGNSAMEYITIQGETYGGTIQKRDYGKEHLLAIFNVIYKLKGEVPVRLNPFQMDNYIRNINMTLDTALVTVPIVGIIGLPNTCEELLLKAEGPSQIDGKPREGIVLRSEDGVNSFKAVSNSYLLKYHE